MSTHGRRTPLRFHRDQLGCIRGTDHTPMVQAVHIQVMMDAHTRTAEPGGMDSVGTVAERSTRCVDLLSMCLTAGYLRKAGEGCFLG